MVSRLGEGHCLDAKRHDVALTDDLRDVIVSERRVSITGDMGGALPVVFEELDRVVFLLLFVEFGHCEFLLGKAGGHILTLEADGQHVFGQNCSDLGLVTSLDVLFGKLVNNVAAD